MAILSFLSGWKTYIAAAGLVALAIYHLSLLLTGKATPDLSFASVWQELLAALAAAGLRSAITKAAVATAPNMPAELRKVV